jgi:hypothetical protein
MLQHKAAFKKEAAGKKKYNNTEYFAVLEWVQMSLFCM